MELPEYILPLCRAAGIIGFIQSGVWIVLSAVAMTSYLNCAFTSTELPKISQAFSRILHTFFLNSATCDKDVMILWAEHEVNSGLIFILTTVTLTFSCFWLIVSSGLFLFVSEKTLKHLNTVIYAWSTTTLLVTVMDIVFGTIIGTEIGQLNSWMEDKDVDPIDAALYALQKQAAFWVLFVAFRGFTLLIMNIALACGLIALTLKINTFLNTNQHSVHTQGHIDAFDSPKRRSSLPSEFDQQNERHGQMNHGFRNDNNNGSWRNNIEPIDNNNFRTENNWQNPRPFSYLEEPRGRPPVSPAPPSPVVVNPAWRRNQNWEPTPDYSPPQNRRLKSALKPGYM